MENHPLSAPKFSLKSLDTLQRYFPTEGSCIDKISFYRLKGYLTALACAPSTVLFSDWWDALKALPDLTLESEQDENELLPLMMTLMDKTLESVVAGQAEPPEPVDLSNYDYGSSPVEQWCQGFMEGLRLSEEEWFSIKEDDARKRLELSFGVVALLASRENMKRKVDAEQFDERINRAQQMLPQVVGELYKLGKTHQQGADNQA